jgi:hypothetical protein
MLIQADQRMRFARQAFHRISFIGFACGDRSVGTVGAMLIALPTDQRRIYLQPRFMGNEKHVAGSRDFASFDYFKYPLHERNSRGR